MGVFGIIHAILGPPGRPRYYRIMRGDGSDGSKKWQRIAPSVLYV